MVLYDRLERGGVQNVIMQIVKALSDRYTFDIVVFDSEPSYYDEEFENYGGKIFRFGRFDKHSSFHARADYYLRAGYVYRNVLHVLKYEGPYVAIHCHNVHESGLCVLAGKKAGVPVRISHTHTSYEDRGNIVYRIYNRFYLYLIREYATHRVGCSSMALERTFKSSDGLVIGNSVNLSQFASAEAAETSETDNTINLLQVGIFSPNKNQIFSLEITNALIQRGVNAKLTLFGRRSTSDTTGYYFKVQDYVRTLKLEKNVHFVSGYGNVPETMKKNMFLLFPSVREGFGIVAIEAQAAGLHCFVSDTVPCDIDCGGCTYLPLELGAQAWADVIMRWYGENKDIPQNYDCSAFEESKIMEKYEQIYEGLA